MKDIIAKSDSTSTLPAAAFNSIVSELENAVTDAGFSLDNSSETTADPNPTQISSAITSAGRDASAFTDSGAANAYVLTKIRGKAETAYRNGAIFRFVPANTNTGASTVNVQSLGAKDIRYYDDTALVAGAILANQACQIYYDSSAGNFKLMNPNVLTTLGDIIYRGSSLLTRLPGNTTTTKKLLTQVGNGTISAAPAWNQIDDTGYFAAGAEASGTNRGVVGTGTQTFAGTKTFSGANFRFNTTISGSVATPYATPSDDTDTGIYFPAANKLGLAAGGSLAVEVTVNGVIINKSGTSSAGLLDLYGPVTVAANDLITGRQSDGTIHFYNGNTNGATSGESSTAAIFKFRRDSSTARSINAAGTVNASGADYAEYMRKSRPEDVIEKGEVCGVDANGLLTKRWSEAISFVIKSTDPSYVGGDSWSIQSENPEEVITKNYSSIVQSCEQDFKLGQKIESAKKEYELAVAGAEDEEQLSQMKINFENTVDNIRTEFDRILNAEIRKQKALLQKEIDEANALARVSVDRIAFCGQVPCIVSGTFSSGDWIVPVKGQDDSIEAVSVSDKDITFTQYKKAIGQVWGKKEDGKALICVGLK